jgi:predicted dithiol-disulfide oxidoreductase (DUF899 family)
MPTAISSEAKVVPRAEWLAARRELLRKEKELTRLRDEISEQRRALPWERVEKQYVFDTTEGKKTLADLFSGRSQLAIYHFMLGPGWQEGCKSCSYLADHFDGMTIHLAHRDVTFLVISHATLPEIETFKKRMGWRFQWASANGTDFNYDYQVSFRPEDQAKGKVLYNYEMMEFPSEEAPGMSAFYKNPAGEVFHTYSSYARGLDPLVGTYQWLDLVSKGRDEEGLEHTMAWVRHHDKYDGGYVVDAKSPYVEPAKVAGSCCAGKEQSVEREV